MANTFNIPVLSLSLAYTTAQLISEAITHSFSVTELLFFRLTLLTFNFL